jgi:NAD(P)-dependent dehydrogenase (short-subunit alcohol dehydrogenase family)
MADVTQSDQCQAMADEVVSRYGSIDILSNNVGIGSAGTVLDAEESE